MAKFAAMMDMLSLVVPFIERDDKGTLVRDQTITFNPGIRVSREKVNPASYLTSNESEVKYLRAYAGNEANGGNSFREIAEKKSEVAKAPSKASPEPVAEAEKEFVFPDDLAESPTVLLAELELQEYADITTVQQAGNILKGIDPSLKSRDVATKDKVTALAVAYNISFPNL